MPLQRSQVCGGVFLPFRINDEEKKAETPSPTDGAPAL